MNSRILFAPKYPTTGKDKGQYPLAAISTEKTPADTRSIGVFGWKDRATGIQDPGKPYYPAGSLVFHAQITQARGKIAANFFEEPRMQQQQQPVPVSLRKIFSKDEAFGINHAPDSSESSRERREIGLQVPRPPNFTAVKAVKDRSLLTPPLYLRFHAASRGNHPRGRDVGPFPMPRQGNGTRDLLEQLESWSVAVVIEEFLFSVENGETWRTAFHESNNNL
ncbi:hypothetical protein K0M31_009635 [Melipona bicolor]|uniref:Uncharacterized protein n=1 Tax=Melipona bicolor TaxID=60889 RepID=A0AA40FNK7_9HYME|nr:hypothetical protein K0M31_009635 [Melipona bicolor]